MALAFELTLIFFLIVLNGWFAMSELAIVSAKKSRLLSMAAEGRRGARQALELAENPGRFFSSVQIGITLVGVLAGAYSGATLAGQMGHWLETYGLSVTVADTISIAVVVGAITYATLIVGELVPKQIALANPERVAVLVARPMMTIARLASPLVTVLELSSQISLAMLGIRRSDDQTVTEEEVKAMIAEGTESGVFQPQEQELLSGVMRFGNRKVRAVMTPRNDVVSIDLDWGTDRIAQTIRQHPYSRLPVYRRDPDEILGVIQAKDMLDGLLNDQKFDPAHHIRRVDVIPDNTAALHCLDTLKRSPIHMALVVDEYGSLQGIVTATDILSSIVGSLHEHGLDDQDSILQRDDGSWLLDGDVPADMAADRTGCRPLTQCDGDYSTVAGFILAQARRIPSTGDRITCPGWEFEVVDMDGRRIDKLLLRRLADDMADE